MADPTDPGNHCLRLCNCDDLSGSIELYCENADKESINRYRGYPARLTYRAYVDPEHPFVKRGTSLTEFGYYLWLIYDAEKKASVQYVTGRAADNGTSTGVWLTLENKTKPFSSVEQHYERVYIQHRFNAEIDANAGTTWYVDDVQIYVEDFYEYPKEKTGLLLILR